MMIERPSTDELRLDASELTTARRQTAAGALVGFSGNVVGAILTSVLYGGGLGNSLRYAHATLCALIFAIAWWAPPSRRLYMRLYAIMVVPILPLLIVWTLAVPEAKLSESFIAFKMVLMGVALLTPLSMWLGLTLLVAFSLETVALWSLHLAGHLPGEPWVTLFYAVFAVALLLQRDAERRLTRRLTRVNAEAAALDRIARASLEVRDRMNTPLQTLSLSIELLEGKCAELAPPGTIERMRRALVRLTELSQRLAEEDVRHKKRR